MLGLLLLFLIPFVMAALVFCSSGFSPRNIKNISFIASLVPLAFLLAGGDKWHGAYYDHAWLPTLSVRLHLSVDHLSLIFLYLTNVIIPISILSKSPQKNSFYGLILVLQGLLIGFFTAKDLIFFTFFFEAILIPIYVLISNWGGKQKEKASFTFIIYMVAGSSLMIAGALSLYFAAGTFDMAALAKTAETSPYAFVIAIVFLLAFAVKTPLFPFHAWLADTYCQAPTPATILLAAILSKAGIYGIIRVSIGLFPNIMLAISPLLLTLAIIGVLYGAWAAWGQTDYKRLIAYSSFSHVNFVLAGLFVWNEMAQGGAILQAVNHAITITGLFLVAAWLKMRLGTTEYGNQSGLAEYMPKLCWLTLFFVLSAVALPGLNNFVSEIMVLYGVFQQNMWLSATLGLTVIFSILYMLRWIHSIYFNEPSPFKTSYSDIQAKELLIATPLIALILWLGLYPATALSHVVPAAQTLTQFMSKK